MTSFQVTLTTLNTNYHLLDLVRVIDTAYVDQGDMVIQADDDGGAQVYLLGGPNLSATRYAQAMRAGDFSAHYQTLSGVYASCDTSAKKMNISISR